MLLIDEQYGRTILTVCSDAMPSGVSTGMELMPLVVALKSVMRTALAGMAGVESGVIAVKGLYKAIRRAVCLCIYGGWA